MTKTHKNLIRFVNATISGFERTLDRAKEDNWSVMDLMNVLDVSADHVMGALNFAEIYECKITGEENVQLRNKLLDAKSETIKKFYA